MNEARENLRVTAIKRIADSRYRYTGNDEATDMLLQDQCRPRNSFLALVRSGNKSADVRGRSFDRKSVGR